MTLILTGRLICANLDEARTVAEYLPEHVELTRAEPGCITFEVKQTDDPLVWSVTEEFANSDAFEAHQRRVQASEWGRATSGIRREYTISGAPT